jgi:hypothetical protein
MLGRVLIMRFSVKVRSHYRLLLGVETESYETGRRCQGLYSVHSWYLPSVLLGYCTLQLELVCPTRSDTMEYCDPSVHVEKSSR